MAAPSLSSSSHQQPKNIPQPPLSLSHVHDRVEALREPGSELLPPGVRLIGVHVVAVTNPRVTGRLAGNEWTLRTLFCLYIGLAHGWILDLLAYSDSTVYHIVGYVCYGAFCFGVWLPTFFEGVKLVASLHHRLRGRIPQPALVAFTLVGLVVTSLTVRTKITIL